MNLPNKLFIFSVILGIYFRTINSNVTFAESVNKFAHLVLDFDIRCRSKNPLWTLMILKLQHWHVTSNCKHLRQNFYVKCTTVVMTGYSFSWFFICCLCFSSFLSFIIVFVVLLGGTVGSSLKWAVQTIKAPWFSFYSNMGPQQVSPIAQLWTRNSAVKEMLWSASRLCSVVCVRGCAFPCPETFTVSSGGSDDTISGIVTHGLASSEAAVTLKICETTR